MWDGLRMLLAWTPPIQATWLQWACAGDLIIHHIVTPQLSKVSLRSPSIVLFSPSISISRPSPLLLPWETGSQQGSSRHTSDWLCYMCFLMPSLTCLFISVCPAPISQGCPGIVSFPSSSRTCCDLGSASAYSFSYLLLHSPATPPYKKKIRGFKQLRFIIAHNVGRYPGRAWPIAISTVTWWNSAGGWAGESKAASPTCPAPWRWWLEAGVGWLPLHLHVASEPLHVTPAVTRLLTWHAGAPRDQFLLKVRPGNHRVSLPTYSWRSKKQSQASPIQGK